MGTTSAPRVGLAIVRVWLEDDWSGSEVDAVLAHLTAWLDSWLARS